VETKRRGRPTRDPNGQRATHTITVSFTDAEWAELERRRGPLSVAEFVHREVERVLARRR
jgi:hypothetical protein